MMAWKNQIGHRLTLRGRVNKVGEKYLEQASEIFADTYEQIVKNTPVDTGEAISGWNITYTAPSSAIDTSLRNPKYTSIDNPELIEGTRQYYVSKKMLTAMKLLQRLRSAIRQGKSIVIFNAVDHAPILEKEYFLMNVSAPNKKTLAAAGPWVKPLILQTRKKLSRITVRIRK